METWPNSKHLRKPTKPIPIEDIHEDTYSQIGSRLLEIMRKEGGIGLSANQVGLDIRMAVVQLRNSNPFIMLNPRMTEHGGQKSKSYEGCLSVPNFFSYVPRYEVITVEYEDVRGKTQSMYATGNLAYCMQHEIDHLDGKLFIDYLPLWKMTTAKKKVEIFERRRRGAA